MTVAQTGSSAIDILGEHRSPARPDRPRPMHSTGPFRVQVRIDGLRDEQGRNPEGLVPGCSYLLQAAIRPASAGSADVWNELSLDGDYIELFAEAEGGSAVSVELQEENGHQRGEVAYHIARDNLQGEHNPSFLLRPAPGTSPTGIALWITDDRRQPAKRASVWPLRAVAAAESPPELPSIAVDPDQYPIPDAAWLYVEDEANRLRLSGFRSMRSTEAIEQIRGPRRADFKNLQDPGVQLHTVTSPERAIDVFDRLREVTELGLGDLIAWINKLRGTTPALRLIIVDQSQAQLPWEMLEIDQHAFLGAEVTVARWLLLNWGFGRGKRALEARRMQVSGRWLHFIAGHGDGWEQDSNELLAAASENIPDSAALRHQLKALADIGLVYFSCHGLLASVDSRSRFRLQDENDKVVLYDAQIARLPQLTEDGKVERLPLVFVNACHSGRLVRDGDFMVGMPSLFLRRIARGYIGTLGAVEVHEASSIGAQLLAKARTAEHGIVVAEVLRELRRKAAAGFDPSDPEDPNWTRFATAFMYVYYGDPRLQLQAAGGGRYG